MVFEDQTWVWQLRNADHVRQGARDGTMISWEAHKEWWSHLINCDRFIFEWNGEKAGVVLKGQNNYWSFYLAEEFTGQGLAFIMLALYLNYYKLRNKEPLKATVKRGNIASIQLHAKLGFRRIRSKAHANHLLEYHLNVRQR